jgi:hypothetical protein
MTADKTLTKEEFIFAYGFYTIEVENRGTTMAKSKKVPTPQFLSDLNALLRETLIKFVKRPADGYNLLFDRAEEIVDHYFKSQQ